MNELTTLILTVAVAAAGMFACYIRGRMDGVELARDEIAAIARKNIADFHPWPIPDPPETDLDFLAQVLDSLATTIERSKTRRTEK